MEKRRVKFESEEDYEDFLDRVMIAVAFAFRELERESTPFQGGPATERLKTLVAHAMLHAADAKPQNAEEALLLGVVLGSMKWLEYRLREGSDGVATGGDVSTGDRVGASGGGGGDVRVSADGEV